MTHPGLVQDEIEHAKHWQEALADGITKWAGSMRFVWIHLVVFVVWCSTGFFGLDRFPFNFLTMTVSLEAIFLSSFVMISQNRADEKRAAIAEVDHEILERVQEAVEEIRKWRE